MPNRDTQTKAKEPLVDGDFEVAALNTHNELRRQHQAPPLVLDQKVIYGGRIAFCLLRKRQNGLSRFDNLIPAE